MTIWQHHKAIFDYVMIEAGCSDNPGVCIKGVRMSEGPLYSYLTSGRSVESFSAVTMYAFAIPLE